MKKYTSISLFIILLAQMFNGIIVFGETKIDANNTVAIEEKIYCDANLEQNFDDGSVLVIMDENVGIMNKEISNDFFCSLPIESITDVSEITNNAVEKDVTIDTINKEINDGVRNEEYEITKEIETETFRQILQINLKNKSKENVLQMIEELEKIDGIKYVGPNYQGEPGAIPNDPNYAPNQWGPKMRRIIILR